MSEQKSKFPLRMIVEAGILIALALILDNIKIFTMPQGGTVTAGSMIPIIIFALRWGWKKGILVGLVFGTMQFLLGPKWSFHPISILFDYSVAWAFLGLAGLFRESRGGIVVGVAFGVFLRFASHVLSGAVVFAEYAPEGMNPWIYSMGYNATYLGVEFVVAAIVLSLLYDPLKRVIFQP